MWILPVEIWGFRYRAKCLSSSYVVYFSVLSLAYVFSFCHHSDEVAERSLILQVVTAPSSLQRNLLEYAILITMIGVYIFLALPETTGLMFEDSDELFSLEEYDVVGLCFPRGSGSGFLGNHCVLVLQDIYVSRLMCVIYMLQVSELLNKSICGSIYILFRPVSEGSVKLRLSRVQLTLLLLSVIQARPTFLTALIMSRLHMLNIVYILQFPFLSLMTHD